MKLYQLKRPAERTKPGHIRHEIEGDTLRYFDCRAAVVPPSKDHTGLFIVGGEEHYDQRIFSPASDMGRIKILECHEHQDLSLESFFDRITDSAMAFLAGVIYLDFREEDFRSEFWNYLDKRRLSLLSVQDTPHRDFALRLGILSDFDRRGELLIPPHWPLSDDLRGLSRDDLKRKGPETELPRINCLSILVSGFSKSPSNKFNFQVGDTSQYAPGHGWMA